MFHRVFVWLLVGLSLIVTACNGTTSTASQPAPTLTTAPTVAASAPTVTRPPATTAPTTAQPTVAPAVPASPTASRPTTQPAAPTAAPSAAPTAAPQATATSGQAAAPATTAVKKLNLNTASAADFLTIPGVGDRMLREFEEYKPYTSILQFRREIGKYVNAQQVAEYEKYIYVPIDVNKADAATLQQMTGLDATEAAALIAGRPYASADAFFAKLAQYVSPDELASARSYVSAP